MALVGGLALVVAGANCAVGAGASGGILGCPPYSVGAAGVCIPSGPSYPLDFYPEMHYTQAFRPEEPPRLDPPEEAVPVTGRPLRVEADRASQLRSPVADTPENLERATRLYQVNCRMCHGPVGHGDSLLTAYFQAANRPTPVDFSSDRVRGRTDGELYANISNGIGGMPPFGRLLSSEERWLLVLYVRSVGSQTR